MTEVNTGDNGGTKDGKMQCFFFFVDWGSYREERRKGTLSERNMFFKMSILSFSFFSLSLGDFTSFLLISEHVNSNYLRIWFLIPIFGSPWDNVFLQREFTFTSGKWLERR